MNLRISINCPSYHRPKVETLDYIKSCKVWVAENEYDEYIKANKGFEKNIIKVPNEVQGNVCRIRNYILDNELKENDAVLLIDDDLHYIGRHNAVGTYGYVVHKLSEEELYEMLEHYTILCKDLGFMHWGININKDRLQYRQTEPFSTKSYIGSPFSVFLKGNDIRYDEQFSLKEDYDMTLQQCNRYRGCLRVNMYFYDCKQSKQAGGCATYRNYAREEKQIRMLQKKWGDKIVRIDKSMNPKSKCYVNPKEKVEIDYNPIIRVPIKGV